LMFSSVNLKLLWIWTFMTSFCQIEHFYFCCFGCVVLFLLS
jgi:hypothetical protein